MKKIWYLLKCPKGNETDYLNGYQEFICTGKMEEIVCFQYQRMMRYSGEWHLERRIALPGYVFVAGTDVMMQRNGRGNSKSSSGVSLTPCEAPFLKSMCQDGSLIEISRGIIRKGEFFVTSGPLKGRESLIRKIDRHKRTAQIAIPLDGGQKHITVGLEIYEKEI